MVVAALVAALGTVLVFLYVRGADVRAEEQFDTTKVLVATAPIASGESIEAAQQSGKVELRAVANGSVLPSAQRDYTQLNGLVATQTIYAGEQLVLDKFAKTAAATTALPITKGEMAISVNLTDPTRVAGFVRPGSEVSIFYNGPGPDQQPRAQLLLDRVTVIGVGSTTPTTGTAGTTADGSATGAANTEQLASTLMTLSVTQEQAQKVLLADTQGELAFALLTKDTKPHKGQPATLDNLFR